MMFSGFKGCCMPIRQRYVFALMCFLGLFNAYSMRACLSIAITKMVVQHEEASADDTCEVDPKYVDYSKSNTTIGYSPDQKLYYWNESTQSFILLSFYAGYIFTHIPGGVIAERYGGKHTLGVGIFLTALFTILTPASIEYGGATGLIINRVLMGFGEGTTYPAINVLLSKWTPPNERSRVGSFVYAGNLMGTIFSTTVSGYILEVFVNGWPIVFYVMGATGIIWFLLWCALCYSSPQEHPFISDSELNYLKKCMGPNNNSVSQKVPWGRVLTSAPVWALTIAIAGYNWGILTIITYLPKYMSDVLKMPVKVNGNLTSLVYLAMWLGGTVFSYVADKLIVSEMMQATKVRKYGATLALTGSSIFIIAASYAGCDSTTVVIMFAAGMTIMGASLPSLMVNGLDLSPNYAGTLMALSNGAAAVTGVISPFIIGILTPNRTLFEWRLVYWILFAVSVTTNVIFVVFGSGKIQAWNESPNKSNPQVRNQKTAVNESKV